MEIIDDVLRHWQILFTVLIVPLWRLGSALTRIFNSQNEAIQELKLMNVTMNSELRLMRLVIFKFLPADAAKEYMEQQNKSTK